MKFDWNLDPDYINNLLKMSENDKQRFLRGNYIDDGPSDFTRDQFGFLLKRNKMKSTDKMDKVCPMCGCISSQDKEVCDGSIQDPFIEDIEACGYKFPMRAPDYDQFLKALLTRNVEFIYLKKDGTERSAFGTLSPEMIPASAGTGRKQNDTTQSYFDLEANDWRTFIKTNLKSWK